MKKIFLFLVLGISSVAMFAQETLTLDDAVMNQYRKYRPESTIMFSWIPNTENYAYLSADYQTLLKGNTTELY